ncbi:hypothetical protein AOLI_G00223160 [Acnodon oligacanthus]
MKADVERLDREKKRQSKFCPPPWPPLISVTEENQSASLAKLPMPHWVAQAAMERVPMVTLHQLAEAGPLQTGCTVYRRKNAEEEDKRIQGEAGMNRHQQVPAKLPCNLCGQPKRLAFGHVTYSTSANAESFQAYLSERLSEVEQGSCSRSSRPGTPVLQRPPAALPQPTQLNCKLVEDYTKPGEYTGELIDVEYLSQ